jgi:hypothetical protein
MKHARHTPLVRSHLKTAARSDDRSTVRGLLARALSFRLHVCRSSHETTGLLRTGAMAHRRGAGTDWGRLQ